MSPALAEEKVARFQRMVGSTERLGISEFARSKAWREKLPEVGCMEVVDRGGLVCYVIAPEYAEALNMRLSQLSDELEQAQIAAMFDARSAYANIKTGRELAAEALNVLDERLDELMEIPYGD